VPRIVLRPSRILAAILVIAHGAALAAVALAGMPAWLQQWVLTVSLVVNVVFEVWKAALLRAPNAVVAIEIARDDTLSIQTRRGKWVSCEVLGSSYVVSFMVILDLKGKDGAGRRAVILPDSLDAEDFRKLRVWLRWKRSAPQA